jgi:HTH-type transcriptional regulator / antitoxin HigA
LNHNLAASDTLCFHKPSGQKTTNTYNSASRLSQVADLFATSSFTYDKNGRVTEVVDNAYAKSRKVKKTYDALGRLATYTDENGNVISYGYDKAGNLIGSRSKVSEVLSRKRPLTLSMIRALHEGLGIPASVLIQEPAPADEHEKLDWSRFPIKEMLHRGWIESLTDVEKFFSQLPQPAFSGILFRTSEHIRSARAMDEYALKAWIARVMIQAEKKALPRYQSGIVTLGFMTHLAKHSSLEHGPIAAQNYLAERGISLVIEPHLAQTYLDGAALLLFAQRPVIGMTLRYDRLDNFWFTLFHELAHISLHSGEQSDFIDDLDVDAKMDPKEREADELAGEALIPEKEWVKSPASKLRSPQAAEHLARRLGIHPAIVAGRMRHAWKAYRLLNHLVGHKEVRREFSQIKWLGK